MNYHIAKLKLKNHLRKQQDQAALLGRILLNAAPLLFNDSQRLRLYDYYLRFNPRTTGTAATLKKAIAVSSKCSRDTAWRAGTPETIHRSIILKGYVSEREKGFLLVSFEPDLLRLANNPHLPEIEQQYEIAFVPTWQPFFSIPFYRFLAHVKQPIWIMPSSARDAELCAAVGPICMPLPFQASSWIDGESFGDVPQKKDIDIIMLANFSEYKRHWLLFEALQDLPNDLQVKVVGRGIGSRTREALISEAGLFGVSDRFELVENASNETIRNLLSRAKLFLALSFKEGSYIALAEALFAGTPVGIYEDAIVGSKDYIGPSNGMLFNSKEKLSKQIAQFLNSPGQLISPTDIQDWARKHISARANGEKLNAIVRDSNLARGHAWTHDLAPFYCSNFDFYYYQDAVDKSEYRRLASKFGLVVSTPSDDERRQ